MTTTTTTTTRLAFAAALAALCLGAAACGTETATPAASISQPGGQEKSRTSPRAAEQQAELLAQIRKLRAQQADARCRRLRRAEHGSTTCASAPTAEAPRSGARKLPGHLS
jgi:hypothetical protein